MIDSLIFAKELANYISKKFINATITVQDNHNTNFDYDIFFLDIDISGDNGIEVARKIRSYKEDAIIIYFSFREDLVFNAMQNISSLSFKKEASL